MLACSIVIKVRVALGSIRSIKAGRTSKYRDYYGLSPNYHAKYECKLPSSVPGVEMRVYVCILCRSCRSTSLWGCLLARLGDESDVGWPRTAAGGCRGVDDPRGVSASG